MTRYPLKGREDFCRSILARERRILGGNLFSYKKNFCLSHTKERAEPRPRYTLNEAHPAMVIGMLKFSNKEFRKPNPNPPQRRKPWGTGGHVPQNLEWGTPMYNVPPDFDIFSVFFPYLQHQRKILYIVFISLTSNCHCAALTTR